MRYIPLATLALLLTCGCDSGGSGGGSGDVVEFNIDCDFPDVDCPGAKKLHDSWGDGVKEVMCFWDCALNTTEFKEPGFEELTEPARHIITFRKVGDNCWRVYDIDTDKCGKRIEPDSKFDKTF